MANLEFSLASTSYRNHILEGFSRLQQNDEFVDMTLAAEGHLVKVHQNIVALASPYLKELLRSVPCRHPVMFLNGVSHDQLCYILEYIYRGEVQVPVEKVQPFLKVAQVLHIAGLKNINPIANDNNSGEENQTTNVSFKPDEPPPKADTFTVKNENDFDLQAQESIIGTPVPTEIEINYDLPYNIYAPTLSMLEPSRSEEKTEIQTTNVMNSHGKSINVILDDSASKNNADPRPVAKIEIISDTIIKNKNNMNIATTNNLFPLPQTYTQAIVKKENQDVLINETTDIPTESSVSSTKIDLSKLLNMGGKLVLPQYDTTEDIIMSEFLDYNSTAAEHPNLNDIEENHDLPETNIKPGTLVYTVSNRGALQMILNDYMYYCHHKRDNGRNRRWRCIDYRDQHCRAAIDTDGEKVESSFRKRVHCHPNHAVKINKKITKRSGKTFSTIEDAEDSTRKRIKDVFESKPITDDEVLTDTEEAT